MKKYSWKAAILLAGGWVTTVGLTFWLGYRVKFEEQKDKLIEKQVLRGDSEVIERMIIIGKLTGKAPGSSSSIQEGLVLSLREVLTHALKEADPLQRAYAIKVILSGLPLGDIGRAVTFVENMPLGLQREELLTALLRHWGLLDGRSAVAYALDKVGISHREEAVAAALAGWTRVEPQAAWKWAIENPGTFFSHSERLNAIVTQVAQNDAQTAFYFSTSIPDEKIRASALKSLADHLFASGKLNTLLSWFADLPEGASKEITLGHIAMVWGSYEPAEAAAWIEKISDQTVYPQALTAIASTWSATDPPRAAEWVLTLPEGDIRTESLEIIINSWVKREGGAHIAAEWLNRHPPHFDFDRAVKKVTLALMKDDPEIAMSWAESIVDIQLREIMVTLVGHHWISHDPDRARIYLEAMGLPLPSNTAISYESSRQPFQGQPLEEEETLEAATVTEVTSE